MILGLWYFNFCFQGSEVWEVFVVEFFESFRVFVVGDELVDGWEMFFLGQFFFQILKYLYNIQCGRGYRVREVIIRGRYIKRIKRLFIYSYLIYKDSFNDFLYG